MQALFGPVLPIRGSVRNQQDFRTGFLKALADLVVPNVFADRQPDAHTAEVNGPRKRPGLEHALFVKNSVVWQITLVANRLHFALIDEKDSVVEVAGIGVPRRSQNHRGSTIGGLFGKCARGFHAFTDKGRFQNKIFRRITGQHQL